MKKMILAAAIVCAATFVHAAACQWSIAGISDSPDTKASTAGAMVAYFMDGSTYSEFTGLDSSAVAGYVSSKGIYSAKNTVGRSGANAGSSEGSYAVGEEVSGYVVIFDNADVSKAGYFANTGTATYTVPGAGNVQFAFSFGTSTSGWQKIGSVTPDPGPVPEPTSGLLLVLGGAALALRRRR